MEPHPHLQTLIKDSNYVSVVNFRLFPFKHHLTPPRNYEMLSAV